MEDTSEGKEITQQYNDAVQSLTHLQSEYNTLKSQYEQAMNYVQETEKLHRLNNELTKENSQLKRKIDDLNSRLEISIQHNQDLKEQLTNATNKNNYSVESIQKAITQEKDELIDQIENINISLKEAKKIIKENKKENDSLKHSISTFLQNAERKFRGHFTDLSDYELFLETQFSENQKSEITESNQFQESKSQITEYEKAIIKSQNKISKLQQRMQQLIKSKTKLEYQNEVLVKKLEEMEKNEQIAKKKNDEDFEEMKKSFELQLTSKDSQISSLQEKIKEKKVIVMPQSQYSISREATEKINLLTDELFDTKAKFESLSHKNQEMVNNLTVVRKQNSQLLKKSKKLETENDEIKRRLEKSELHEGELEKNLEESQEEIRKSRIEIEELKTQLHFNESQSKTDKIYLDQQKATVEEMTKSISNMKIEIAGLQSLLNKQKKELCSLYSERKNMVILLHRQSSLLKLFENQTNQLNQQKSRLTKQLAENEQEKLSAIQQQQAIQNQIVQQETVIPLTVWAQGSFPTELKTKILEEVEKSNSSLANKIERVLNVTSEFYQTHIEKVVHQRKNDKNKLKKEKNVFKKFIREILENLDIKTNEINDEVANRVIETIAQMNQSMKSLQTEKQQLKNMIDMLNEKLKTDNFSEATEKIEKLLNYLHQTKENLKNAHSKNRKLEKGIAKLSEQFEKERIDQKSLTDSLTSEKEKLISDLNRTQNSLNIEKSENEKIKTQLNLEKMSQDELIQTQNLSHEQQLTELSEKYERKEKELCSEISTLKDNNSHLIEKVYNSIKELEQTKKVNMGLRDMKESLNQQMTEMKSAFIMNQKDLISKFQQEKKNITSSYGNIINQLKTKNETLRKLLDTVTDKFAESEFRNRDLVAANARSQAEKRETAVQLESQKTILKRERQLMETKVRATQLSNDVKVQNLQEEMENRLNRMKQEIYSHVASSFSNFFNAKEELNDDQFKSIISAVSKHITRLEQQEKSIKELIGASNGTSIEEAVSRLLIASCH